jgi:hypothetical protein
MPKEVTIMRISLSVAVLASAVLLGFSAGGAQAGRFFGAANYGADSTYQYSNGSQNPFGWGPGPSCQGRRQHRHRLFHRDQGVANGGMPANAMPGYGMPPVYGMPFEQMQTPMVQSPILSAPIHMTSVAPGAVPVVPAVQSPSCSRCGQSGQLPVGPAVQSRIVPVPAAMPPGPTTAEPPPAEPF